MAYLWQRLEYTEIKDCPWEEDHWDEEDDGSVLPAAKRQRHVFAGCVAACFLLGFVASKSEHLAAGPVPTFQSLRSAPETREAGVSQAMLDYWVLGPDPTAVPVQVRKFLGEPVADVYSGEDSLVLGRLINVTLTNPYTAVSPIEVGEYAYPWEHVTEPFRVSTLSVTHPADGASYQWMVEGHVQGYGSTIDVVLTRTGYHSVVVTEVRGGAVTGVRALRVMAKYARREIRSLTDVDREKFFDAVMIMAVLPTSVGQTLYGDKYKSKDYFTRVHLYFGGKADCDHWHQGAGFVTSHVALTLEFEQALQSIFPDVAMPYWDFTLESTFFGAIDFRQSNVFASSWFGAASPDNELHTVTEGRWAFTPAMTDASAFSAVHNSYGVLRSPWNNDPTPFMTRHDHIYGYQNNLKPSGCFEYHNAMRKSTWMTFSKQLNSAAHGHLHETMGGSWNHRTPDAHRSVSPAVLSYAHEIQALSKNLWRAGFVTCPDECDMTTAWEDCQCTCDPNATAGLKPYEILSAGDVLGSVQYYDAQDRVVSEFIDANGTAYLTLPNHNSNETQDIYAELLESLCSPGHIGDMFQATSSNDITFWVLHGTLDRLWHFKRLGDTSNFDETWDPYHPCSSHNPDSFQPFKNLFDEADSYYSNARLYDLFNPAGNHMPYLYDNFQWPHCDMVGYRMRNH